MSNNALYLYGIIRSYNKDWKEHGIKKNNVFLINEGNFGAIVFSAIVHRCKEKPYVSNSPVEVRNLILTHNNVLDKAMKDFGAVIPLSFNTIIKTSKSGKTAEENLRNWLKDNEEDLIKKWNKINGKEEYGIRIYYEKEKLLNKIKELHKIKQLQQKIQIESTGMAYLLKGKIKDETNQIAQKQILEYRQNFYNNIRGLVSDIIVNPSKILLDEEKDLLLSISILANKEQIQKVNNYLVNKNFYFNVAGPFAPYSFVNSRESEISMTPKTGGSCRNG